LVRELSELKAEAVVYDIPETVGPDVMDLVATTPA
jgi:hypothetical protein